MKAYKFLLIATLLISTWAQADAEKKADDLVFVVYSATWCPACKSWDRVLDAANLIPRQNAEGFRSGAHEIEVNGQKRNLVIMKIETDVVPQNLRAGFDASGFQYVPALVVTDLGQNKVLFEGTAKDFFSKESAQSKRKSKTVKDHIFGTLRTLAGDNQSAKEQTQSIHEYFRSTRRTGPR